MRFTQSLWGLLPLTATLASAAAVPDIAERACTNGPSSRQCWTNGFDINTDFETTWPNTGRTVYYNLDITNGTCNPDGHGARICLLFNNQYPGPTIQANWGDKLHITVTNSMQDNGTSIHWHGVRQYNTIGSDGVNGLTECPLAPGKSRVYEFTATQYGTSWYHAHFSSQYGDGVVGTLQFNGPASANYDVDLGTYTVNEWYYQTAFQINSEFNASLNSGLPGPFQNGPSPNNLLINGTNKDVLGNGKFGQVTITSGKRYRLRIVCVGVSDYMHVSLDMHTLEIIAADFVPVQPYTVDYLTIAPGQRYDVVITANQIASNYWFRIKGAGECGANANNQAKAIWTYAGVTPAIPLLSPSFVVSTTCSEPGPLTPVIQRTVPTGSFQSTLQTEEVDTTKAVVIPGGGNIVVWALNASINVNWMQPTLEYVMNGQIADIPAAYNVVPTTQEGDWNYWLIQQASGAPPIPHPIHLHGHNFMVLGQGSGTYSSSSQLNFLNPEFRDTASVFGGGWLAVAFRSNNPGSWLMHCHIAWHISEGLGLQFLESPQSIVLPDQTQFNQQCADWDAYYATSYWKKDDSGL